MIYKVYGEVDYLLETRVATSAADRGAVSALHRMGLGVVVDLGLNVVDVYGEVGVAVVEADRRQVEELKRRGIRVEEDVEVRALLKESVPLVGAPRAWELGYTGKGVKIAVLDTGVSNTCGLEGKVEYAKSFVEGLCNLDFLGEKEGPEDLQGHGTHVAAIAASSDGEYRGVAPRASIINIKVLNRRGRGSGICVARGIVEAMRIGADVINLSLGGPGHPDDLLSRLVNLAASRGHVVVVAAGNSGPGRGTISSPGVAAHAITVGATDKRKRVAEYSSRGPVDGMMKPELVAPGGDEGQEIVASRPPDVEPLCRPVGKCYMGCVGTSMATPHVSGAVALLLEAMGGRRQDSSFVVKKILMETAEDLGEPREAQGAGLLRVDKAVEKARGETAAPAASPGLPLALLGAVASLLMGVGVLAEAARRAAGDRVSLLSQMYREGKITLAQLVEMYRRGEITFDELRKIVG